MNNFLVSLFAKKDYNKDYKKQWEQRKLFKRLKMIEVNDSSSRRSDGRRKSDF